MDQVSKSSVRYGPATVPGRRCGTCVMYHPATGTCDLVAGEISPADVCDRWEPPWPPPSKDGLPALWFDVDGVLAFQPEGSILSVNARFGAAHLVAEATTYPWAVALPIAQQAWLAANMPIICANLAPDTKAIGLAGKARKAGYPVGIATERGQALTGVTKAWLDYWKVPYDTLFVTDPGGKAALIAARGNTDVILIDDDPAKEKLAGPGVRVWVPPRPWTPDGDPPGGVWRFTGWRQVKKKLGI